ncbi:MAG: hypothetical protein WKF84_23240 [Pyrinomonadaceae bacterium]
MLPIRCAHSRNIAAINSRDQIENSGNSTFNAGYVQIQRRFSQGLNLLASYTFSKTITDADSTLPINGAFSGGGDRAKSL